MKILIIEDTLALREDLAIFLQDSGYTVLEADSGEAALLAFREKQPDLVICDIRLPDTDGLFLLKSFRTCQGARSNIPVVIVSAYSDAQLRRKAEDLGIVGFLVKPVDYTRLFKLIGQILKDTTTPKET